MKSYWICALLIIAFSCADKQEEAIYTSAIETTYKLVEENENQYTTSFKIIHKNVLDNGSRQADLYILKRCVNLDLLIQDIIKLTDKQLATFQKKDNAQDSKHRNRKSRLQSIF